MKVFIAVPSLETVPALFCQSLALLQRAGDTMIGFEVGSLVYNARNSLARQAIKAEADYVLWLDSDMVFGPDLCSPAHRESYADLARLWQQKQTIIGYTNTTSRLKTVLFV